MDAEGPDCAGAGPADAGPAVSLSAGHLCAALLTPPDQRSVETRTPPGGASGHPLRDSHPLQSPRCWEEGRTLELWTYDVSCYGDSIEIEDLLSNND